MIDKKELLNDLLKKLYEITEKLTMGPRKDATVPCTLEEHKKYIEDENRSMNKYTSTTNPRNDLRWEKQKNNQTPHIK